ncbi:MAG: ABC transporter ATP-binding protein [Candidatus Aenigmarchaeota archaeon]|nr:ABC transporter ATP-binding protein [Candidatus Aenigmarchaeota archaeon]
MKKEKKIDLWVNFFHYLDLVKQYKFLFIGILFLTFLIESVFVIERFLFKIIVDEGTLFAAGMIERASFVHVLLLVALVYVALIVLTVIGRWILGTLNNNFQTKIVADLKRAFFNHIVTLSHDFHSTHKTGSLISRLTRGGRSAERLSDVIFYNVAPLVFQFIVIVPMLLYFDASVAVVIVLIIIAFTLYSVYIQRIQQYTNVHANDAEDQEKAYIGDMFTNIESVKYFGKEHRIKRMFFVLTDRTRRAFVEYGNFFRLQDIGHELIIAVGTFFVIYLPIMKVLDGSMSLGTLVFIYTVFGNFISPLYGFDRGLRDFYRSMADLDSLYVYASIENEIKDQPHAPDAEIANGTIEFKNISFRYHNRPIFTNFSLTVLKNKRVALVGHSGSGKTTLVKLLYRFYDVDGGDILIDGKNVKDVKQESLRSELSIVPQDCVLFDDTIYSNIAFSNPQATRKQVFAAIKAAQLDTLLKRMPNKEKTVVGERGIKLSGGEKQRVSIARAILANKKVLVMDEATSSLDSKTEHDIQQSLKVLMKGRTVIIIAHRLSTIMNADIIVVMDKGKIVQQGNHHELITQQGTYKKLWNLQKGGYIK